MRKAKRPRHATGCTAHSRCLEDVFDGRHDDGDDDDDGVVNVDDE